MSTLVTTPGAPAADDGVDAALASPPKSAPAPGTPAPKTAAEKRGDEMFGEDGAVESTDPSAAMFGIREFRAGKGGKGRHARSLNADLDAATPKARPIPPGAKPGAPKPGTPSADPAMPPAGVGEGEPAPASEVPPEDPSSPEVADLELSGGRKFSVPKPVAENVAALRGQYKAFERRAREGVESANAWKAHAESIQARLDAMEQGRTAPVSHAAPADPKNPSTGQPPATSSEQGLLEAVDWPTFDSLYQQNPTYAIQWMAEHTEKFVSSRLDSALAKLESRLTDRVSPLLSQHDQSAATLRAGEFFIKMAETQDEGGYWYPELHNNPTAIQQIAMIWKDYPEDFRYTQRGFDAAYNQWHAMLSRTTRSAGPRGVRAPALPGTPGSAHPSPADLFPPDDSAVRAAGVLDGQGASAPRPTGSPRGPQDRGDALADAIGNSGSRDNIFGVMRRGASR